jgi:hypothetical protein
MVEGDPTQLIPVREKLRRRAVDEILGYIFDGGSPPQTALEFFDTDIITINHLLGKVMTELKNTKQYCETDRGNINTLSGRLHELQQLYTPIPL